MFSHDPSMARYHRMSVYWWNGKLLPLSADARSAKQIHSDRSDSPIAYNEHLLNFSTLSSPSPTAVDSSPNWLFSFLTTFPSDSYSWREIRNSLSRLYLQLMIEYWTIDKLCAFNLKKIFFKCLYSTNYLIMIKIKI